MIMLNDASRFWEFKCWSTRQHQQHRSSVRTQSAGERVDSVHVERVRRLVENQQLWPRK